MPPKITTDEIDHAKRLYASGKSFDEVARALGRKSSDGIRKALARAGVESRPAWSNSGHNRIDPPADLVEIHASGDSVLAVSERFGVSRDVVARWYKDAGLPIRTARDAALIRASRMTEQERRANASAAHATIRSMGRTDEWQKAIAKGRERVEYGGRTSPGTDTLCKLLDQRSIPYIREKAIGRYNVDIALPNSNVAVEVLGGNWHGSKPIHSIRTPYILNSGWDVAFVWDVQRCKIGPGALEQLIAYADLPRRDPSAPCEYRVIRGDGKVIASGCADDDEFPLVPPSVSDLH